MISFCEIFLRYRTVLLAKRDYVTFG